MDAERLARIKAFTASLPEDSPRVALEELLTELHNLSDVAEIKAANGRLVWANQDQEAELERLRGQVKSLRDNLDGNQPTLARAAVQLTEYRGRLQAAEAERDQLRATVQPLRESHQQLAQNHNQVLAELGQQKVDHEALASVHRTLQQSHEEQERRAAEWQSVAARHGQEAERSQARESLHRQDAERLARWIIDHPTGPEDQRSEVLSLHDRVG